LFKGAIAFVFYDVSYHVVFEHVYELGAVGASSKASPDVYLEFFIFYLSYFGGDFGVGVEAFVDVGDECIVMDLF